MENQDNKLQDQEIKLGKITQEILDKMNESEEICEEPNNTQTDDVALTE